MVVGEVAERSDVVVVGGGPGGYAAAIRAAQLGRLVTLIERDAVGGVCLNVGCIPSKTLIELADRYHSATDAHDGVSLTATLDWPAVQAHLHDVVTGLTNGVRSLLDANGVRLVSGTARFVKPDRLVIDSGGTSSHHEFDRAIIATGSRPVSLPGLEVEGERVLDSTGALFLDSLPASVAIVGAGYIGIELGTALAKLGVTVRIVEMADRILAGVQPRLAAVVARRLRELGVEVYTDTRALGLTETGLALESVHAPAEILAERVIVAVGRRPNTDRLGLENTGVKLADTGHIIVDPARIATRGILAIGDVTAGPALAHKATAEAEVAARTACGLPAAFDPAVIAEVIFSDPEVVSVGLTAQAAIAAGAEGVRQFSFPFGASARAHTIGRTEGHAELVADGAGTILGAHLVGRHVSELAGEMALAVELAATVEELAATIHPHPTMSEALAEAAHGLDGHPLHVAVVAARR